MMTNQTIDKLHSLNLKAMAEAIADAILDRLVHNSHRIELAGESMRKRLSPMANTKREDK